MDDHLIEILEERIRRRISNARECTVLDRLQLLERDLAKSGQAQILHNLLKNRHGIDLAALKSALPAIEAVVTDALEGRRDAA